MGIKTFDIREHDKAKREKFEVNNFSLTYDRDYGIDRRSGWTVVINGVVVVQLTFIWKALFLCAKSLFFREYADN